MGDGKVEISFVVISVINSPNANLIWYKHCLMHMKISVVPGAVRSQVSHFINSIVSSNPAEVMDVRLLCLFCVV